MLQRLTYLKNTQQLTQLFELETLKKLVEIPSLTSHNEGVQEVQEIIAQELKLMGFSTTFHQNPDEESAMLLYGFLKGKSKKTLTVVFHADTVCNLTQNHSLQIDQLTAKIYGPGVADNKGGVVMALSGLKEFLKYNHNKMNLQIISSPNEETGSNGFHQLLKNLGLKSHYILGFEPALKGGGVISSRGGNKWYNISIRGLAAHSGRKDPHVNAAHELCIKINKLQKLNQFKNGLRLNIGQIQSSSDVHNIVCGDISAKLDLRFVTEKQVLKYTKKVEKILERNHLSCPLTTTKCLTSYQVVDYCPPMSSTKRNKKLKKMYLFKEDYHLVSHSGGAADINHLSHANAYCLDGLGPIGGGMHTTEEYIELNQLDKRVQNFVDLLKKINLNIKDEK